MTRTERAVYPRAIIKDRSESKSGMDKSLRKGGGGAHNWGSVEDEYAAEYYDEQPGEAPVAMADKLIERVEAEGGHAENGVAQGTARRQSVSTTSTGQAELDEEKEKAREFRAKALKGETLDLGAIARTSAAVSSPQ